MALTVVERQVLDEEGQVVDAGFGARSEFGSLAVYRLT